MRGGGQVRRSKLRLWGGLRINRAMCRAARTGAGEGGGALPRQLAFIYMAAL